MKTEPKSRPESWEVETETKVNGRLLEPGTEFSFRDHNGRRRRATFIEKVSAPGGTWITAGELERDGTWVCFRSVAPEAVLTVHRNQKRASARRKERK